MPRNGGIRDEELWRRIATSYKNGYTIPQLAIRFRISNAAVRYILAEQNLLKRKAEKCGANA